LLEVHLHLLHVKKIIHVSVLQVDRLIHLTIADAKKKDAENACDTWSSYLHTWWWIMHIEIVVYNLLIKRLSETDSLFFILLHPMISKILLAVILLTLAVLTPLNFNLS
jgi:hypothetical protein